MVCRGRVLRGEARVLERLRRFDRRSYFGLDRSRRRRSRRGDVTRTTVIRGAHCASLVIEERRKYVPTTLMNKPFHGFTPPARAMRGRVVRGAPLVRRAGLRRPNACILPGARLCQSLSGAVQTVSRGSPQMPRCRAGETSHWGVESAPWTRASSRTPREHERGCKDCATRRSERCRAPAVRRRKSEWSGVICASRCGAA
jgi:hypothetical protein